MFTNVSWGNYLIAIGVLLLIWYFILVLKFYYRYLKKIISGEQKLSFKFPVRKKAVKDSQASSYPHCFDTQKDAEELSERLILAISESAHMERALVEFKNYLHFILDEYPYVKKSALRENINKLIVSECLKYPRLLLTFGEVDSLWEKSV